MCWGGGGLSKGTLSFTDGGEMNGRQIRGAQTFHWLVVKNKMLT